MRVLAFAALLALSACGTTMGPIFQPPVNENVPLTGQIVYRCDNGAQLAVDYQNNSAQVAIVGGPSMVLPSTSGGGSYTNGRYTLSGGGRDATWQAPGGAPT